MPRFAANLTLMFTEHAFLDRFAAAAEAGFTAVEFLFPYDHPPQAIAERLARHGLTQALFNLPPGDWAAGERGLAALPDRFEELRAGVETGLRYAKATGVARLHLMAGELAVHRQAHRLNGIGAKQARELVIQHEGAVGNLVLIDVGGAPVQRSGPVVFEHDIARE